MLLYFCFLSGAKAQIENIDKLLLQADTLYINRNFDKSLELIERAQNFSEKDNYSFGIVKANIRKAEALVQQYKYEDALYCLSVAALQKDFKKDNYELSNFYRIRGTVKSKLKLYKVALEDFGLQLKYAQLLSEGERKSLAIYQSYENLVMSFRSLKMQDSLYVNLQKQEKNLDKLEGNLKNHYKIRTNALFAEYYLNKQDLRKAEMYIRRAENFAQTQKAKDRYFIYEVYGRIATIKNNPKEAAYFFENAFLNAYQLKLLDVASGYAKKNSLLNKDLDSEKSLKYLEIYNSLNDSLAENKFALTNPLVDNMLRGKDKDNRKKTNYIWIITLSAVVLIGFMAIYKFRKYKRKIVEQEDINNKEQLKELEDAKINLLKEKEQLLLTAKDNKYGSLIELAKNNNPEFLLLFRELYPNFVSQLQKRNPTIRNSEISFMAMAFLNFSSKEIAAYTYVTISAVHSRKNRLRKKYGIPSEVDFNQWVQEFVRSNE